MFGHPSLTTVLSLAAGLALVSTATPQTSQTVVKDINTNLALSSNIGSNPYPSRPYGKAQAWVSLNGWFYFSAKTDATGYELFKSDGTKAILVKDIHAGKNSSYPRGLTVVGKTLYFSASTSTSGIELWKSDGTEKGTALVKEIGAGSTSSSPGNLARIGSKLCFSAYTSATGTELWISDGTDKGTVILKDIRPGTSSSMSNSSWSGSYARSTLIGHRVFFAANDGRTGTELWVTDGTSKGTQLLKDLYVGSSSSNSSPRYFRHLGATKVVFEAFSSTYGREIWVSDGTSKGTTMLLDIYKGTRSGASLSYGQSLGAKVFFHGYTTTTGSEPWVTDGTTKGTLRLADVYPGGLSSYIYGSDTDAGKVYWSTRSTRGYEIWESDGTPTGTKRFSPGTVGSSYPRNLAATNGMVFFEGYYVTSGTGREISMTDGKTSRTVKDIYPGRSSGYASYCSKIAKGVVAFRANDGKNGPELWISKGTTTTMIEINKASTGGPTANDNVYSIEPLFGKVIFSATDGRSKSDKEHGQELWISDGSAKGTMLLKDIYVGTSATIASSSSPSYMCRLGNYVYFSAYHANDGRELWRTDGTPKGTTLFKDIQPGALSSNPGGMTRIGDKIYFTANNGTNGYELWVLDGTAKGTRMVKDINLGSASSSPSLFARLGHTNRCVFRATVSGPGASGTELWVTDGSSKGTTLVMDIYAGAMSSLPMYMKSWKGKVYFSAQARTSGRELWETDGTSKGTKMTADIYPGASSSYPAYLEVQNGKLYFQAYSSTFGYELFRSDGTATGTMLYWDIYTGRGNSYPLCITAVGSRRIYFRAYQPGKGYEMVWVDTTTNAYGTYDIYSGFGYSYPYNYAGGVERFAVEGGSTYFRARETIVSDYQLHRIVNGATAKDIGRVQGSSFMSATDPRIGKNMKVAGGTSLANPLSVVVVGIEEATPQSLGTFVPDSFAYFQLKSFWLILGSMSGSTWSTSIPIPNDATLVGDKAILQSFALDFKAFPGRVEVTNGVHLTFGK